MRQAPAGRDRTKAAAPFKAPPVEGESDGKQGHVLLNGGPRPAGPDQPSAIARLNRMWAARDRLLVCGAWAWILMVMPLRRTSMGCGSNTAPDHRTNQTVHRE